MSGQVRRIATEAGERMGRFDEVSTDHVPRELNARADELANAGSRKSKERMRKNAD